MKVETITVEELKRVLDILEGDIKNKVLEAVTDILTVYQENEIS